MRLWAVSFLFELAQEFRDGAAYLLGIDYLISVSVAIDSEELHISTWQKILRVFSDREYAQYGRGGLVGGDDHFCRCQLLIQAAVVCC